MKLARTVVALAVASPFFVLPAPAQAVELGGYELKAEAAPIAMHIYEKLIPIPAEPQLEVDMSFSRANFSTGPTGRSVSSLFWLGDAVGYGLPELLKNPDAKYPIKVDAAHPSGPKDGKQELVPGTGMVSHADEKGTIATSSIAKPQLPLTPPAGIPIPPMLIAVEAFSSESKTVVTADKVTSSAYATAGSISLLGGLVQIHGLRSECTATSDGSKGTASGKYSWGSITVAGQTFAATDAGVQSPLGVTPLPKMPDSVVRRLADFGLTITPPTVEQKVEGAAAKVLSRGMTITLDTSVMKSKLSLSWLLDPLMALLPKELRNQVTPWLDLAPKFVFMLGTSAVEATAVPAFTDTPIAPPADTGSGSSGGSSGGGGDITPAPTGEPVPVASAGWPVFPGVPFWLVLVGLAMAAAVAGGLKKFAALMFGAGGCDLGAANGVPNLREQ
ncbi:choice-of-anchor P family protein [Catelliglobosispora koreensis]|uniref:choice-of-anchor P family protein n=1 Tax=Catelliglobosispora koreensis TaxID=129052 RepID=UPI0003798F7D|nr:choice-of-anchor P family protein [Catelliglobosispora koreensis]